MSCSRREPLRACFVIDKLSRAGTETQLLWQIRQFDRSVVVPYLCLLNGHDAVSEDLLPADCQTIKLGVQRLASAYAIRRALTFWRFLIRERIDLVQTYFPDSTCFAAPIAKAAGVKAVLGSRRNIGHWMTNRDIMIARFYNRFFIDKIVVNCRAVLDSVMQTEKPRPNQVMVVPNGLDLGRFDKVPTWRPTASNSAPKVGMVGNLRHVKGIDLFIRAAKMVLTEEPNTRFEVAGGGDQVPYQSIINELGVTHKVQLLGEVTDIPRFLATLDLAVLPSRAEGASNALLEYMAAGRPIVATNVGGNAELLGELAALCCIPTENVPALAGRMLAMLRNKTLCTELAERSRQRAESYSHSSQTVNLYRSLP